MSLGNCWAPSKFVILDHSTEDAIDYQLYDELILRRSIFVNLNIPFKPGGHISPTDLIMTNTAKTLAIFAQLVAIGVNPKGSAIYYLPDIMSKLLEPSWTMA
ncbi:hypothetical protein RMATCC62417_12299 [Rhizopus microsporus]|nr:hypothetical protein RMATCC62417_12299 [Rhizopus microsporus]